MKTTFFCYNEITKQYYFVNHPDYLNEDYRTYLKKNSGKRDIIKFLSGQIDPRKKIILNLKNISMDIENLVRERFESSRIGVKS